MSVWIITNDMNTANARHEGLGDAQSASVSYKGWGGTEVLTATETCGGTSRSMDVLFNIDYDEIHKVTRYSRHANQAYEVMWISFFDDFSISLLCWLSESVSKKIIENNTLILERG